MRRALAGLPEQDLRELDNLAEMQHTSRAELIRQAVTMYLDQVRPAKTVDDAFGLWKNWKIDGLDYQKALRAEW